MFQKTIAKTADCSGVGLHSGKQVRVEFHPAPANTGVVFAVRDGGSIRFVHPTPRSVVDTNFATTIECDGIRICTVEHLLAAVRGLDIDNLVVQVHGAEIPIMDGSAGTYVDLFQDCGIKEQNRSKKVYAMTRPVEFSIDGCWIKARPSRGFSVQYCIDFPHPSVGRQQYVYHSGKENFVRSIARARTFGFVRDVERMHERGLILGGSLDNALVLDENGVVNEEGMRYPDEPVRHKILDFIGDLGLMKYPLWADFEVHRSGHQLNNLFLRFVAKNGKRFLETIKLDEKSQPTRDVQPAPVFSAQAWAG